MTIFDRLGLSLPVVQAPMAGVGTPALAAAVSDAGALGSIAVGATDAAGARIMVEEVRVRTDRPFNVNLFVHGAAVADAGREAAWLEFLAPFFAEFGAAPPAALRTIYKSFADDADMLAMLSETRPPVVSFHFGLPSADAIAALRSCGILLMATATNLVEARAIEAAGIDIVVAQGIEAGGPRGVFDPAAQDGCWCGTSGCRSSRRAALRTARASPRRWIWGRLRPSSARRLSPARNRPRMTDIGPLWPGRERGIP
jgi:nitronate monooxygenase